MKKESKPESEDFFLQKIKPDEMLDKKDDMYEKVEVQKQEVPSSLLEVEILGDVEVEVLKKEKGENLLPKVLDRESLRIQEILKGELQTHFSSAPRSRLEIWDQYISKVSEQLTRQKKGVFQSTPLDQMDPLDNMEKMTRSIRMAFGYHFAYFYGYGFRVYDTREYYWKQVNDRQLTFLLYNTLQKWGEGEDRRLMNNLSFFRRWQRWYSATQACTIETPEEGGLEEEEERERASLLACPEGCLNLANGLFLDPTPNQFCMRGITSSMVVAAPTSTIMDFMLQLGAWNPVQTNLIRSSIKKTLLPAHYFRMDVVPYYLSEAGMGKSSFFLFLMKLREGEAAYVSMESLASSTFSKMPLAGKKFIVIDEINPKSITTTKTSFIKTIVSGETAFVEVKYDMPAELKNCQMIMGGNFKLTFDLVPGKGDDSGIRRRLLVINARSQHGRLQNDKEIRKKLDDEMGAIVQWALDFPDDLM